MPESLLDTCTAVLCKQLLLLQCKQLLLQRGISPDSGDALLLGLLHQLAAVLPNQVIVKLLSQLVEWDALESDATLRCVLVTETIALCSPYM
jgi:hypothetical protein